MMQRATVAPIDTARIRGVSAEGHLVGISNVSAHCGVADKNPRPIDISPGDTSSTSFEITSKTAARNQIAFDSKRDGDDETFLMSADGSNVRKRTDNPAHDRYPVISHDGTNPRRFTNASGTDHEPSWIARWVGTGFRNGPRGERRNVQDQRRRLGDAGEGNAKFRLKQVDVDGTTHVHDPITVEVQMEESIRLEGPAPNPATQQATLSFAVQHPVETHVTLHNTLGQKVATLFQGRPEGETSTQVPITTADLASGIYFIRLQAGPRTRNERLIVVR